MICPNCHTDFQGNFCPHCGTQPGNSSQPQGGWQQPAQTPPWQGSPQPPYAYANPSNAPYGISDKDQIVALLLCIFLGGIGVHRFYVGKIGTGILYIFTFGLFGIGYLVDIIMIACGSFTDSYKRPLRRNSM